MRCVPDELVEAVAEVQHEIWRDRIHSLFTEGTIDSFGALSIPILVKDRWLRQCRSTYLLLLPGEQNSYRRQALKVLETLTKPELVPAAYSIIRAAEKRSLPFDLNCELARLRTESQINTAHREQRSKHRVVDITDTVFAAKIIHTDPERNAEGQTVFFDRMQISDHDREFLCMGAELWSVEALEEDIHGRRMYSERLIFEPPEKTNE